MINTNVFFDFTDFQVGLSLEQYETETTIQGTPQNIPLALLDGVVREILMIHVGGTRCVPSSTDNSMKIHARITLTVEVIRTCLFVYFYCMFEYNYEYDHY